MKKWIALTVLVVSIVALSYTLHPILEEQESAGVAYWLIGIYSAAWVYATMSAMAWMVERKLFTYFVTQGYSEEAADREIAKIAGIRRLAERRQPGIDKERDEYERLRQKFDPKPPG